MLEIVVDLVFCGVVALLTVAIASHRGRFLSDLPRTKRGHGAHPMQVNAEAAADALDEFELTQGRPPGPTRWSRPSSGVPAMSGLPKSWYGDGALA